MWPPQTVLRARCVGWRVGPWTGPRPLSDTAVDIVGPRRRYCRTPLLDPDKRYRAPLSKIAEPAVRLKKLHLLCVSVSLHIRVQVQ